MTMPQPQLPDELVEEVLLRFPPENPAGLVRAALVSKLWCRLISDPGFRRRFREFHRTPPMLGFLCDCKNLFIPTSGFCLPRTNFPGLRVLDVRHGRVLGETASVLVLWDPITDEVREVPRPLQSESWTAWTAAVLCSAAPDGACDHLDCHHGPFLVVFVCTNNYGNPVIYTYSSNAAAWSEPVIGQHYIFISMVAMIGSALVGNTLYFGNLVGSTALKYDLELRQVSVIRLPSPLRRPLLTTTEDGGLGVVSRDDSKLYMWSRRDTHQVDAEWERRVIELNTVFPVDVDATKLVVIGTCVGIIFMSTGDEVYTIDLRTFKVKKVYEGTIHNIRPYMGFYTPVLRVATTDEGPSADASTAEQTKGADQGFLGNGKFGVGSSNGSNKQY